MGPLPLAASTHRKARQAAHEDVTLTGLYNVLAKLRAEQPLSAKERLIHEHGLVAVLRSLHDELDAAVLQAYGRADLQPALADHRPAAAEARAAAVETLLERLVALNAKRAAEEAAGTVRWLRPEFQARSAGAQAGLDVAPEDDDTAATPAAAPAAPVVKRPWPAGLPEQIKAVAELLATSPTPLARAAAGDPGHAGRAGPRAACGRCGGQRAGALGVGLTRARPCLHGVAAQGDGRRKASRGRLPIWG
jgi:hypothetical protein